VDTCLGICDPMPNTIERFAISHVIYQNHTDCVTVIRLSQGSEPLASSGVPGYSSQARLRQEGQRYKMERLRGRNRRGEIKW
jgi:hypothetical protein